MLKNSIQQYFAIEINENAPLKEEASIKLWRVTERPSKKIELLKYKFLGRFYDLVFREFLKEAEEEYRLSAHNCGLVLPRSSFIMRIMDMPAARHSEMRKMVSLQIGHMLPYDFDDIIFDFSTSESKAKGPVSVALFVITKQVIGNFIAPVKEMGISLSFICPSTPLIKNTYNALIDDLADDVHIFVDVDAGIAEVVVLKGDRIMLTRNMIFVPERAADFVNQIVSAIEKEGLSLANIRVQHVLFNQRSAFEILMQHFRARFPHALIQTINYNSALQRIKIIKKPSKIPDEISLSLGIGLVLGRISESVDLLPEDMRREKMRQHTFRALCFTMFFMIILSGLLAAYFVVDYSLKNGFRGQIKVEEKAIELEIREANKVLAGVFVINEVESKKSLPIKVMSELYRIVPSNVFLTFLDYDVEDGLKIRGMAKQLSDVSDLTLEFQRSPYFGEVELKFAKKRVENGEEFTDFQIDCLLLGETYDEDIV
jgi:hypothetical protein